MKSKSIHDPYHNPFRNRFHVPVHSRLDEMQAFTHMIWLTDRTPPEKAVSREEAQKTQNTKSGLLSFLRFFVA